MIGSETNRKKFALAGVIELACYDLKIKCLEVSVNTWRKPFMGVTTGGTKFLKDEAMRECVRRGWFVESDDEADACGILSYAMSVAVPGTASSTFLCSAGGQRDAPTFTRSRESRIEWKMYDATCALSLHTITGFHVAGEQRGLGDPIVIDPQVTIGSNRVDFLVFGLVRK